MSDEPITLMSAAREHFEVLEGEDATIVRAEVERFVRWAGADRQLHQLTANEVANYGETFSGTVTDAAKRGEAVKSFLLFVKELGYTSTNLGAHLRIKRRSRKADRSQALEQVEVTAEEKAAMEADLANLKAQRPQIIDDIRRAMADKDFRENAPLDAAREHQAYVESRIRKLEVSIDQAVIVEAKAPPKGDVVEVGCAVVLENISNGKTAKYTLVRPGEIDAAQGKISYESPVGQALLNKVAGDEVEVGAPSGSIRFRIINVEA